ncbi:hypothetical protein CFC21_107477 [Triticum aestivum]|uniref:DUF569 domain-containing protein n=2 Tax=Triticum aestivum TaxID=4565 RepID=A0A9R1MGE4_WHEAT|nr:hypothetical protein CFC21_107477 [Triticum aestivum]
MEQFHHGQHVRLRSRVHGTYLHADEDGHGVSLHHRRASMNAAWAVHLHQFQNAQYLLLHSAAYGRYLAATDAPAPLGHRGLRVEQRNYNHPEVDALVWQAILSESGEEVYLRHIGGRRLRANGRHWNTDASVDYADDLDNISRKMLWVVEDIPAREVAPPLPRPTGVSPPCPFLDLRELSSVLAKFALLGFFDLMMVLCDYGLQLPHLTLRSRLIMYVLPTVYGALLARGTFVFRGRSVFRLRKELARQLGVFVNVEVSDLFMCLPTQDGRLFPLVVDLPRSGQTLHIIVAVAGTPAQAALRYADVDA